MTETSNTQTPKTTEKNVPLVKLNDGRLIPQLGFGVWRLDDDQAEQLVAQALEAGYRHIDTAALYGNEAGVGRAIAKSGIAREELFITTKLWNDRHEDAPAALDESLEKLGLDYVDLYLIHWPCPDNGTFVGAWKDLVELREAGKARTIGVSNFLPEHLEVLESFSDVTPAVNQVEAHPYFSQAKDIDTFRAHGVATEAWGPLGQGKNDVLEQPEITEAAQAHGKSPAQVILRWHIQNGTIVFPKTANPERLAENIDIFDFELSGAEMAAIHSLDRGEDGRGGKHPLEFNTATV